jgi:glycine reductase
MDPDNQGQIKSIVDEGGGADLVVLLGATDPEALEVAAETVREGDPAFVGPLAGVQLGLPVMHVLEEDVKEQVAPAVYEEQIGLVEISLDVDAVRDVMRRIRDADPT